MDERRPEVAEPLELTDPRSGPRRRAFAVADRLAVHGSLCVCPRCAGRLLDLWRDLAASLDAGPGSPV